VIKIHFNFLLPPMIGENLFVKAKQKLRHFGLFKKLACFCLTQINYNRRKPD